MTTRAKQPKKVLLIYGDIQTIGQSLTNLYGLNPDLVVHDKYVTQAVITPQPSNIFQSNPQGQPQFVTVIYVVYSNPGDLEGFGEIKTIEPQKVSVRDLAEKKGGVN